MSRFEIFQFPCLSDNYGVLLHDGDANVTASIDAPEQGAIEKALGETGWTLTHILNTHHHHDHTGANAPLKAATGCTIVGPRDEAVKIPGLDVAVGDGDTYDFGGHVANIIGTPGHTLGHITYHFGADGVAFAGDTLFPLGCGRVFEGTMEQMWASLEKLAHLPPETIVYCGHEYTQSNASFALHADPDNQDLRKRAADIDTMRAAGTPTVPTTIGEELLTNPFLRAGSAAKFGDLRVAKDNF
ncbi:MAG: hydroxyacylglutathione hydrolase [Hyphomicrobiales bacterium]